jgi:hypothetical protein
VGFEDVILAEQKPQSGRSRAFVGVHMKCCNIYVRAYVNPDCSAYVGWCPRCAAQVRIPIVEKGGSTDRFFGTS